MIGAEGLKLWLRVDLRTVFVSKLLNVVLAMIKVELFKPDAAKTDGETFVGLGIEFN